MRRTFLALQRFILFLSFLIAAQFPLTAFAEGTKVYIEDDCMKVFGLSAEPSALDETGHRNETVVKEDSGYVSFDRVTVFEKREEDLTALVQIRNCRTLQTVKRSQ